MLFHTWEPKAEGEGHFLMTLNYYQTHAQTFFDGTVNVDMSSLYETSTRHLVPGSRVLDAGCRLGRDAKAFQDMGYRVEAFDASPAMVELALGTYRIAGSADDLCGCGLEGGFDGIWCCASLLHVPALELPGVMQRLADALKPGGVLYVSFKYGDGEQEVDGRRFTDMDELRLRALVGVVLESEEVKIWMTHDIRPLKNEYWVNGIFRNKVSAKHLD